MSLTRDYDVLIVGAGMAGASLAARLGGRLRVAILEREAFAGLHATGRSAAMYLPSYGPAPVRRLTRASRLALDAFGDGPDGAVLRPRPAMHVAGPGRAARLQDLLEAAPGTQLISTAAARAQIAILRPDVVAAAALEPDAGDLDVARLHQAYLRRAAADGAQLYTGLQGLRFERRGSAWIAEDAHRRFRAPVLVNAAGAWADQLAADCGLRPIGLQPLTRTVVLVDPPAGPVATWPIVKDVAEGWYFRPFGNELLVTACDETPSPPGDAQPEEIAVAEAMQIYSQVTTEAPRRVRRRWAGLRTFAADRTPVIGWSREAPGFFWMAGQGGYGIQTAPAAATLAAAVLLDEALAPELQEHGVCASDYTPERAGLGRPGPPRP